MGYNSVADITSLSSFV